MSCLRSATPTQTVGQGNEIRSQDEPISLIEMMADLEWGYEESTVSVPTIVFLHFQHIALM